MTVRASVSVVDTAANVVAAIPVATIDVVIITYEAFLDSSGRIRFIFDSVVLSDAFSYALQKPRADSVTVADIETLLFNKGIPLFVSATDAFSRQVDFNRIFTETPTATDQQITNFSKGLKEFPVATESVAKAINKFLADAFALNDDTSANDGSTFVLSKYINNVAFANEAHVFLIGKSLTDSASAAGEPAVGFGKALADSASVAGEPAVEFGKGLADLITALDLRSFLFSRPLSDSISLFDAISLGAGKGLANSTSTADSGSVLSQGYTEDNTYFLEDYVGEFRTFS